MNQAGWAAAAGQLVDLSSQFAAGHRGAEVGNRAKGRKPNSAPTPIRDPVRPDQFESLAIVSQMPKYASLDRTFGALADPTRRGILQLVSTGPASISELARPNRIALPTVLEHVRILEETRLLTTEKVGRVRVCRLGPERLDEARQWIESFRMWERRLEALDRFISTRTGRRA
jgi:DNA-binding transcriptional ArsR family regulator